MVDMAAIAGFTSSVKVATDIAKGLVGLRDTTMLSERTAELLAALITAQQQGLALQEAQLALIDQVRRLEKEVADAKTWETEQARYQLTAIASGVFAYSLKEDAQPAEPPHLLCVKCYGNNVKSILQHVTIAIGRVTLESCPTCRTDFITAGHRPQ